VIDRRVIDRPVIDRPVIDERAENHPTRPRPRGVANGSMRALRNLVLEALGGGFHGL
jgi:hypothetical protein